MNTLFIALFVLAFRATTTQENKCYTCEYNSNASAVFGKQKYLDQNCWHFMSSELIPIKTCSLGQECRTEYRVIYGELSMVFRGCADIIDCVYTRCQDENKYGNGDTCFDYCCESDLCNDFIYGLWCNAVSAVTVSIVDLVSSVVMILFVNML
ncbi:uncharacterized protein [Amphiura filiformis]|uniref:uncharacterized protein n=1 Tax=Amphiura filiformis TaxID=82378 RepID=UPI003B228D98